MEQAEDSRHRESVERTITATSSQVQALEAQIATQTLTTEQATRYFRSEFYASHTYATASQIRQLAAKSSRAVKGISTGPVDAFWPDGRAAAIEIPEPKVCEFCGKQLDHIAILERSFGAYEWETRRWSETPMRCRCDRAAAKWRAQDAEEKRLAEEAERQRQEAARKERIARQLAESGMKPRFLARTFANFQTNTPGRTKAHRIAKEYADNFAAHLANGDGLYIEGTFGTGKTHLAAAIAIDLMEQGRSVIFKTADDLLRDIKATFDETGRQEQRVVDKLKNCDLLVIDDIGKEQATDWSTAQLYAIINDRYERMKPLIITTNFNETDLVAVESPKGVGEHRIRAILSRLHETCRLMTMNWQDWRGAG